MMRRWVEVSFVVASPSVEDLLDVFSGRFRVVVVPSVKQLYTVCSFVIQTNGYFHSANVYARKSRDLIDFEPSDLVPR